MSTSPMSDFGRQFIQKQTAGMRRVDIQTTGGQSAASKQAVEGFIGKLDDGSLNLADAQMVCKIIQHNKSSIGSDKADAVLEMLGRVVQYMTDVEPVLVVVQTASQRKDVSVLKELTTEATGTDKHRSLRIVLEQAHKLMHKEDQVGDLEGGLTVVAGKTHGQMSASSSTTTDEEVFGFEDDEQGVDTASVLEEAAMDLLRNYFLGDVGKTSAQSFKSKFTKSSLTDVFKGKSAKEAARYKKKLGEARELVEHMPDGTEAQRALKASYTEMLDKCEAELVQTSVSDQMVVFKEGAPKAADVKKLVVALLKESNPIEAMRTAYGEILQHAPALIGVFESELQSVDSINPKAIGFLLAECKADAELVDVIQDKKLRVIGRQMVNTATATVDGFASMVGDISSSSLRDGLVGMGFEQSDVIAAFAGCFGGVRDVLDAKRTAIIEFATLVGSLTEGMTVENAEERIEEMEAAYKGLKLKDLEAAHNEFMHQFYIQLLGRVPDTEANADKRAYLLKCSEDCQVKKKKTTYMSTPLGRQLTQGDEDYVVVHDKVRFESLFGGRPSSSYCRRDTKPNAAVKTTVQTPTGPVVMLRSASFGAHKMVPKEFNMMNGPDQRELLNEVGDGVKLFLARVDGGEDRLRDCLGLTDDPTWQMFKGLVGLDGDPPVFLSEAHLACLFAKMPVIEPTDETPNRLQLTVSLLRSFHTLNQMAQDTDGDDVKLARLGMIRSKKTIAGLKETAGVKERPQLALEHLCQMVMHGATVGGKKVVYIYIDVPQNKLTAHEKSDSKPWSMIQGINEQAVAQMGPLVGAYKGEDAREIQDAFELLSKEVADMTTSGNTLSSRAIHLYHFVMDKLGFTIMDHCQSGMDRTSLSQAEWRVMKKQGYTFGQIMLLYTKPSSVKSPEDRLELEHFQRMHAIHVTRELMVMDGDLQALSRGPAAAKKKISSDTLKHPSCRVAFGQLAPLKLVVAGADSAEA